MSQSARVFISYAHERENAAHGKRILAFANRLRADGIESRIDQYVEAPEKGWRLWMEDEIEAAEFVLIVATAAYERRQRGREQPGVGLGVRWEGAIIGQEIYESALVNTKFVPVVFERSEAVHVPSFLRDHMIYVVGEDEGYRALRRRLTKQPAVEAPAVGPVRELPPESTPEFLPKPSQGSAGEASAAGARARQAEAPTRPHVEPGERAASRKATSSPPRFEKVLHGLDARRLPASRRRNRDRRPRDLAIGGLGIVATYAGALAALAIALTSRLGSAEKLFPRLPDIVLWAVAGLPLLAALTLHALPAWRRTRAAQRLADWTVRPQAVTDVRPFRISAYEDTVDDRERYNRADGVHHAVLSWLQQAPQKTIYLTGASGSGKSSLLNAYVLPALREGSPPTHSLIVRSYDDPLARLADQLWEVDTRSPYAAATDFASLRSRLQAAAAAAGSLLLVFDQFEQFLIVHEGDEKRLSSLRELITSLAAQALPGIRVLLVLRSDYQPMLQSFLRGAALPALELDVNWRQVDVFRERQAREFLQRGLELGPQLMDEVFRQIAEVEGTPGLVRPITLNMFGLVLDTKALPEGRLVSKRGERGGLLLDYLRRSLAQPNVRHHGPAILRRMITHRRVAVPRNVADLAEETGFSPDLVTGSLLELATSGLTRRLDSEHDLWEISHDFVAEYLDAILRPGKRWLAHGLRAAIAVVAVGGWLTLFLLLPDSRGTETAKHEPMLIPAPRAGMERSEPQRRIAVLIGIDDYSASNLRHDSRTLAASTPSARSWRNLRGAAGDARAMRDVLVALFGFQLRDIVLLTDQAATRAAILAATEEHLVRRSGPGDVLFFYYSGHGSQVRNSASDEPDHLDESLVPADSRLGQPDIRDKELRRLFNQALDRGARLTVLLDTSYNAWGARGLADLSRRTIKPDLRDVRDSGLYGPRLEDRGALVLAAAEDHQAWETQDEDGNFHGLFSWAWLRSLRDAVGEPAIDTFLRAQARMRDEGPYQSPVIAGNGEARLTPFLGVGRDRRRERPVVVERVTGDGSVIIAGGWINGIDVGSRLQLAPPTEEGALLEVTKLSGVAQSEARLVPGTSRALPSGIATGALLHIVGWAASPGPPLRVWTPRGAGAIAGAVELARELADGASGHGVRWIADPTETTPTHLLRWRDGQWELLAADAGPLALGSVATAAQVLAALPPRSALFVHLPAPAALLDRFSWGPDGTHTAIESTDRPDRADYVLTGRFAGGKVEYAWLRPLVTAADVGRSALPLRSGWQATSLLSEGAGNVRETALALQSAALRLQKIQAWHRLATPAGSTWPYRLQIRRARDGAPVDDGVLVGSERYGLTLVNRQPASAPVTARYVYAFAIDSEGKSVLLFPRGLGSVENRFPLGARAASASRRAPDEIRLGPAELFRAGEPYGMDTYFVLTTDELLPNPWILDWPGLRQRGPRGATALEELLSVTGGSRRSASRIVTSPSWSLDKLLVESVPPSRGLGGGARDQR